MEFVVIALVTFFGTILQTVAGFGAGFFVPPALLLYFSPASAVIVSLLIGNIICLMILFAEQRKREFSWEIVIKILLSTLPGLVTGALIVSHIRKQTLQIVLGILILLAVLVQEYVFPKPTKKLEFDRRGVVSGLSAGVLSSTSALAAPPLLIWLRSFIITPAQLRDTLTASFLFINNAGIAIIYFFKPVSLTGKGLAVFAVCVPFVVAGHQLGRRLLGRIDPKSHHSIVFGLIVFAGLLTLALGLGLL
jgi:uncharacterized membrane protein YfcA